MLFSHGDSALFVLTFLSPPLHAEGYLYMPQHGLQPYDPNAPRTSVRLAYIQNVTDLLHVCLTRNEIERAKRAWRILVSSPKPNLPRPCISDQVQIQCREVDWKSRWYWALHILNAEAALPSADAQGMDQGGRDAEKWLRQLRVVIGEKDVCQVFAFRQYGMN